MTRAVVVLSGGGAKAAAHAGAVQALHEAGIEPARFVATSMGAVVAAALAAGVHPSEIPARLAQAGPAGVRPHPLTVVGGLYLEGILQAAPFRAALRGVVPCERFAELRVPLTVTAVDIVSLELLRFGFGGWDAPLIDVLAATCALPPYFAPVIIAGRPLADGGLRGPLPLAAVGDTEGLPVVAVDVGPGFDLGTAPRPDRGPALVRSADTAIGILMAQTVEDQLALWQSAGRQLVYVRPQVERDATFRVERVHAYAAEGYRAAAAALAALDSAGSSTRLP
ncbi:MAG TPA: patatin-like phospholipase family protein [Gemmatimonadales bacterium]|nr:patatin-like phospholipase family protein [Gemmatimonadales bacterium]